MISNFYCDPPFLDHHVDTAPLQRFFGRFEGAAMLQFWEDLGWVVANAVAGGLCVLCDFRD